LEAEAFNNGIRPAINPGLSVSRVGGSAQIKAMKKIAGPLRIELAQYRELAAFAQFGSDLSKDTLDRLRHGERIVEILKQPQYAPLPVEHQVLLFYILTHKYFSGVNVENVQKTEKDLLTFFIERHRNIIDEIRETEVITELLEHSIQSAIVDFFKNPS
jgi:F-type H+-transporting ATPase subunit alpha